MASNRYQTDVKKDEVAIPQTDTVTMPPFGPVPVTLGVASDPMPSPIFNALPSPIFNALLAGDVANRGISWYAQPAGGTNLLSRVRLLMAAEQAILEVYRAQNS